MTHSNLAAEIQSYAQPAIAMANLAVSNLLSFLFLSIPNSLGCGDSVI